MEAAPRDTRPYADSLRRGLLPELLATEDVALVLRVGVSAAQKAISAGTLGPYSRIGRRIYVRREVLLEAIRSQEVSAPLRLLPVPPPPSPRSNIIRLLPKALRRRGRNHAEEKS